MIKKRLYLIIAIAIAFILLTVAYFAVIAPLLEETNENEKIDLLEGEVMGSATTILMFNQVERANIQSIEVHNEFGGYTFYYDDEKKDFFFKDYLNSPYSKEMISSLVTDAGFPTIVERIAENTDNLEEYGLSEKDNPAYYILTTRNNKTHKVYIGNMTVTGGGYYARYEGRDAIYVVPASIKGTILSPVSNLMSAMLFLPLSQTDYFAVKDFILAKNEKAFVKITSETKTKKDSNGNEYEDFVSYKMLYPAEYNVSSNYDNLLQTFMECYGTSVEYLGKDDETISDKILEKYNLKNPAFELFFEHKGIKNDILISKQNDDGTYYAYSLLFNIICVMDEQTFSFLEWDLLDFVDKPILQYSINDVSSITVNSKGFEETFLLYVSDGETTTNPVTGTTTTKKNLQVKLKSTDKYIQNPDDFRQFYMGLLTTNIVTYASEKDPSKLDCLATIKVLTRDGKRHEFSFYPYESLRCLYTLNGKGEFYVLKTTVEKLISDAQKLVKGEPVKYQ